MLRSQSLQLSLVILLLLLLLSCPSVCCLRKRIGFFIHPQKGGLREEFDWCMRIKCQKLYFPLKKRKNKIKLYLIFCI
jgi:hypothetical protein